MRKKEQNDVPAEAANEQPPPSHVTPRRKKREVLVSREAVTGGEEEASGYEPVMSRHIARQIALQVSYQLELTEEPLTSVWGSLKLTGEARHIEFLQRLLKKTLELREKLDEEIAKRVEKWSIERLALTDHLLLRLAMCELLHMEETPPKVVLNEAIELAKEFSTTQSGRFINGILDAALTDRFPKSPTED